MRHLIRKSFFIGARTVLRAIKLGEELGDRLYGAPGARRSGVAREQPEVAERVHNFKSASSQASAPAACIFVQIGVLRARFESNFWTSLA